MKILLVSILMTLFVSSVEEEKDFEYHRVGDYNANNKNGEFEWTGSYEHRVVGKLFVDGCMYITITGYHESTITHAGNCPNQIHKP